MKNSSFRGPGTETGSLQAANNRDRYVLMPWHLPVRVRSLVKKNSAHGKCACSQDRCNQLSHASRVGKRFHFWRNIEKIANCEDCAALSERIRLFIPFQDVDEVLNLIRIENVTHNGETVLE